MTTPKNVRVGGYDSVERQKKLKLKFSIRKNKTNKDRLLASQSHSAKKIRRSVFCPFVGGRRVALAVRSRPGGV